MLKRFKKFIKLSVEEKKLFVEAYLFLGIMRLAILTLSFKRLTKSMQHSKTYENTTSLSKNKMEMANKIGKAINRASLYTPWESACLVKSITAHKMLKRRDIAGVIYLGVAKNKEFKAHAWTQCGANIITGKKDHEKFTIISVFS